jgi:hypothetical protein
MMGINGRGGRGWKALQKGIWEPLLCEDCEQHFNEYFEKPFLEQWVRNPKLPDPWNETDIQWITVDYASFKLFHLSVLFRAGVSSLPTFQDVQLGPHEEKIRKLLLARSPGEDWQYPVFGYAVVHHKTNRLVQMVSRAVRARLNGQQCYGIMYGGAQWWVGVSSSRNPEFEKVALRADGRMPFSVVPWNEVGVVKEASEALNSARP